MFYFKACPKCQGDMYTERDQYGSYIECLHCGLIRDIEVNQELGSGHPQMVAGLAIATGQKALSIAA